MKTREIAVCDLCGKARLATALKDGLCLKCRRACGQYPDDRPLTREGLDRLLDDLGLPPE